MELNSRQFPKFDKEAVEADIRQSSADYIASQPKEQNLGFMHSGINQFLRRSNSPIPEPNTAGTNWAYTGPRDPYKN